MRIPIIFQYLLLAATGYSQALFTNDNSLVANTGVSLSIEGSAINSGTLVNEGAMRLYGDWTNSGDYRSVSGTFDLIGDNLRMNAGTSFYYHIGIDGNVDLLSDLNITGSLELNSGVLNTFEDAALLLGEEVIVSFDNDAYINGILFSSQQGDVTFPVGTPTASLPVTLYDIISSQPIGVQVFEEPLDLPSNNDLDAISPNRYWQILDNGGFSISRIQLTVLDETFIENEEEAVIGFTSDLNGPVELLGFGELDGSLNAGVLSTQTYLKPGYYVIADRSVAAPPLTIINIVTPLQDGKHDFLRIQNIEFYENNRVEIFDRTGNKVFEISGYNNMDRAFVGESNTGGNSGVLPTGNYYYTVQAGDIKEAGFLYLKN